MNTEQPIDRRAARIRVTAEQDRLTRAAGIEHAARQSELDIARRREELALQKERRAAEQQAKRERRYARQQTRRQISARIGKLLPTVGRRVMICGPILAPMTVAWIGQIGFATGTLGWPFLGALVFAAAWELTTAFAGWMYHQARKDGDRGALFRVATWLFAASAGGMNYWHALNGASIYKPTPKAVSYGAMSLVGIALWELYSSLIHRKHLREEGIVASARPRFGVARWARYTRLTWTAWSLSVRYGIRTVDEAWSAAVAETARREREKDARPSVRVTIARTIAHTVAPAKSRLKVFWVTDQTTGQVTAQGVTRVTPGATPDRVTQGTRRVTSQATPPDRDPSHPPGHPAGHDPGRRRSHPQVVTAGHPQDTRQVTCQVTAHRHGTDRRAAGDHRRALSRAPRGGDQRQARRQAARYRP